MLSLSRITSTYGRSSSVFKKPVALQSISNSTSNRPLPFINAPFSIQNIKRLSTFSTIKVPNINDVITKFDVQKLPKNLAPLRLLLPECSTYPHLHIPSHATIRYYVPLKASTIEENKELIPQIPKTTWSNVDKLPGLPLSLSYEDNVIRSRHIGQYYLLTIKNKMGERQRYRAIKIEDRQSLAMKNEQSVWMCSQILGEEAHFRPPFFVQDHTKQLWHLYRYVEGISVEEFEKEPFAFQKLPDDTAIKLHIIGRHVLGLEDLFPKNLVQPLNKYKSYKFSYISNPLPSAITDKVQLIDCEDAFGKTTHYFDSFLYKRAHLHQLGEDRYFKILMSKTEDPFINALIRKRIDADKTLSFQTIIEDIGNLTIPNKILEKIINSEQKMNLVLQLTKRFSYDDLLKGSSNHQYLCHALRNHLKTTTAPLTFKQYCTGNFGLTP